MQISLPTGHQLAPFEPTDEDACFTLLQDQSVHVGLYLMPNPYRQEDFRRWLLIVNEETEGFGKPLNFAIRNVAGTLIGGIGAKELLPGHKCEIGYWLGQPYWGHGIMTVAVDAFCTYLRDEFHLVRITATVFAGNAGSMRVLEKNNFQHEGRAAKYYCKQGRYIDGELYAKIW